MIGHLSKLFTIFIFVASCSPVIEEPCEDCELEIDSLTNIAEENTIDNSTFIDLGLVGDVAVEEQEEGVYYAAIESETHEIIPYEGLLTGARYAEGGYELDFKQYSYWDDAMDEEVKSADPYNASIFITKAQNDYLGFIDFTKENNLLAWDYFECVFKVNYYLDKKQNNIALKFSNLGKLEWDG